MSDTSPSSPTPATDPTARAAGGPGTGTLPGGPAGERPGGYPTAPYGSGLPARGHAPGPGAPWTRHDVPGGPPGTPPTAPGPAAPPPGPSGPRRRPSVALVAGALAAVLVAGGVGGAVGYEAASSAGGGSSVLSSAPSSSGATDQAPAAAPGSVEQVADTVLPSVVQLEGPSGEGSGVVISADGLILTNAHVLEAGQAAQQQSPLGGEGQVPGRVPGQAQGLTAVFQNGNRAPVQVVGTDTSADLAVVRAQGVSGLTPATIGDSSQLRVGQEVVAVGSPLGLSGTVTTGIVSALQRPVATGGAQSGQATVLDAIQTDAAINPGNSGGALVDMQGRVIGITSAIASLGQSSGGQSGSIGLGFAIPIDQAQRIGTELINQGYATRAVLGVGVTEGADGAVLGQIAPGGPAAAAGLQQGDVVTRVDDRVIPDADSLVAAIRSQEPGAQVTLTVTSPGGQPRPVPVTLGSERSS
ncbi:S1C family serine protease [Actinomycetospora lemnae]|uniref:Trypsin-like peptidase domain-containing protein n=1 Tax=Actinomycetospora lemnae TaxID=3019891 RepID=A0ABT5SXN1_9PSEU|nr:trypsin-like peptidase domain-containing protein [Actinomycetospora sp. DW7H6]MDD7967619.1 trypsin-like peptidase domain-containing protein [Actinomycetospora sp. DW7H6]